MDPDPQLLSVPVAGTITSERFHTYLGAIGSAPYEQWKVAEYETPDAVTRRIRVVNLRDGMSEVLTFSLDTTAGQWRRTY